MKRLVGLLLVWIMCAAVSLAQEPAAKEPSKAGSASEQLKQLERDWTDAQKSGDVTKMSQMIADDWVGLGADGAKMDKKQYLEAYKSGSSKAESVELGPLDVIVRGNVGIVQGSDTEKSVLNGKDSSGKYVWMDVFEKKAGKWQAIRSEVTKTS